MSSAAWPAVVAAVFARATAVLPGVRVVRGEDLTDNPGDVVYIAVQNFEDLDDWTSAGTFRQDRQSFGGARLEEGSVNGVVFARNGGTDQGAATTSAFGYLAAIEADVRADPTLGITDARFDYVKAEMDSGEIREIQASDGASTALPFVISYDIRII